VDTVRPQYVVMLPAAALSIYAYESNVGHEFQSLAAGPVVAGGRLFVPSGYVGVRNGAPGNVLLVFGVEP